MSRTCYSAAVRDRPQMTLARCLLLVLLPGCGGDGTDAPRAADARPSGDASPTSDTAVGPVEPPSAPVHGLAESPPDWRLMTGPAALTPRASPSALEVDLTPTASGLTISAARNERESAWLLMAPGAQGESVEAVVSGLEGATVAVYAIGFTDGFADTLTPVRPGDRMALDPEHNTALLLDVAVREDAAAGDHAATLTLTRSGHDPVEVPVTLHVFDFSLPREIHFGSQLNLSMAALVPPGGTVDDARNLLFGLRLTPANPVWPSGFRWDITWDSAANPQRCRAFWDEPTEAPEYAVGALARRLLKGEGWNGVGFPDAELFQFVDNSTPRPDTFCGEARGDHFGTPAYNAAWSAWLAALRDYLSTNELLDRTYAYLQNEPQDAADARLAAHLCRLTRAAAPGLRIAVSEEPTPTIAEDPGGACGYDLWIAELQHYQPAYALTRMRDHGEQVWLYSLDHDPDPYFNPTSPTRDLLHARVIPWVSWRLRTRGWVYYDGGRFFPEGRPNLRALALRDGFEDYEYLYLANGGHHPTPGGEVGVDHTVAGLATSLTDWNHDPAALQTVRDALGAYLGGERDTLPVLGVADPSAPVVARYVNLQDPNGEPHAEPLSVDGHIWEKVGWQPWDAARGLGFQGEHVGQPDMAKAGYDDVAGVSEIRRSYIYDDWGRPALFELALAPGRWHVRVGLGRPAHGYPNDPHNLTVEGVAVVVDRVTTDAEPTFVWEGDVEVQDGRLSVGFGGRSALTGDYAFTFLAFVSAEP